MDLGSHVGTWIQGLDSDVGCLDRVWRWAGESDIGSDVGCQVLQWGVVDVGLGHDDWFGIR
jgi:hypothetical protein